MRRQSSRRSGRPGRGAPTLRRRRGDTWEVHEERIPVDEWTSADADAHQSGYGVGWLILEGDGVAKRLRLYPTAWHLASDRELERLWARARRC